MGRGQARSGQRADSEPAVTEFKLDRLAAVPNSHGVNERLVADTNAASDAEVTRITAPEDLLVNDPKLAAAVTQAGHGSESIWNPDDVIGMRDGRLDSLW
jgi:hypothetical protein